MDFLQRGGGTTDLTKKQACAVWKEDHHIKTPTFVIRGCEITPYNRRKKGRHEKIKMIFSQRLFIHPHFVGIIYYVNLLVSVYAAQALNPIFRSAGLSAR